MTITSLPQPRPVGSVPALRWGILGTGWIAARFCAALRRHTAQRIAAVGSRTPESAARFAATVGAERAHGSYAALVADPGVDVVYVATPHPFHLPDALLAIEAGKHVLVEKLIGINADQARRIAEAARSARVFCAEALWSLFTPKFDVIAQLLADGVFGDLTSVQADIGEWFDPGHRIFDPALAGGCMLDLATYPVMFSTWIAGPPAEVRAVGGRADSGVMATTSMVLRTDSGIESLLQASMAAALPTAGAIGGSSALLQIDGPFYQPGGFTLQLRSGGTLRYDEPAIAHEGLFHQALHVAGAIGEGRTEAPIRPLADTITMVETMDRVRDLTGDRFVMEDEPTAQR